MPFPWPPPELQFTGRPDQTHPDRIPPHLVTQPSQASPAQRVQHPSQTEVNEVFARLKWSILDSPPEVQIFNVGARGESQWQSLFENPNLAIAEEAATEPPQSRLNFVIEPLHNWWHWHDAGKKHLRPGPGLIENTDGRPISVKQFIQGVHDYAVPLRKLLCQCTDIDNPSYWPRARFYFQLIMGGREINLERSFPLLDFHVVEDPNGEGVESAWLWEALETRFGNKSAPQ